MTEPEEALSRQLVLVLGPVPLPVPLPVPKAQLSLAALLLPPMPKRRQPACLAWMLRLVHRHEVSPLVQVLPLAPLGLSLAPLAHLALQEPLPPPPPPLLLLPVPVPVLVPLVSPVPPVSLVPVQGKVLVLLLVLVPVLVPVCSAPTALIYWRSHRPSPYPRQTRRVYRHRRLGPGDSRRRRGRGRPAVGLLTARAGATAAAACSATSQVWRSRQQASCFRV